MNDFVQINSVSFTYNRGAATELRALEGISLDVEAGMHLAVLGRNASGKSTLAKLINALERPDQGEVLVAGISTADDRLVWELRSKCGMVFQNPDNQIVATTVEEDVAFGPENLGVEPAEIRRRVDEALEFVGLSFAARMMPSELSGGQKQKLAIAGILAMRPDCLILDEATSMLDPLSRAAFMDLVLRLQRERGLTLINITHNMSEALLADRVLVLHKGKIMLTGTPREVFHYVDAIRGLGLDVPIHSAIAFDFAVALGDKYDLGEAETAAKAAELVKRMLCRADTELLLKAKRGLQDKLCQQQSALPVAEETIVEVDKLSFDYKLGDRKQVGKQAALQDVSFTVRRGEVLGIMGHSGSGKSTLIQHLNGVLRLQSGSVKALGFDLSKLKDIKQLRRHIALLFQYPEHQLFAATVAEDIAFGPQRLGLPAEDIPRLVEEAMAAVNLEPELAQRSPFELSGGQKRRVAMAGLIACNPDLLILDEPAAGLDPVGREEILAYVRKFKSQGKTVIFVSHNMDELARMSDRILVLYKGRKLMIDTPELIFASTEDLGRYSIVTPESQAFLRSLSDVYPQIDSAKYTALEAALEIVEQELVLREAGVLRGLGYEYSSG